MEKASVVIDGIHLEFQEWLNSPRATAGDYPSIINDIRGLLNLFDYGHFKLADDRYPAIDFMENENPPTPQMAESLPLVDLVVFKKAFRPMDLAIKYGECRELSKRAILLIRMKYPELDGKLFIVSGIEPQFFHGDGVHYFLILCEDGIENGKPKGKIWCIDPSLKVADMQERIGYKYFAEEVIPNEIMHGAFAGYVDYPIAITSSGDLVNLRWSRDGDGAKFCLSLQSPFNGRQVEYDFNDEELEDNPEMPRIDPEIMDKLRIIRSKIATCVAEHPLR